VKLFIDILRLKSMMTGMSVSQMTKSTGSGMAAAGGCLRRFVGLRSDMEVVMTKLLTGLLAVAIVAAVAVGAMRMGAKTGTVPHAERFGGLSPVFARAGMLPEVVSTAEMPRLVMPTVEVHAYRTMAMSFSVNNVN
jgi:hypothetical protein